MLNLGLRLCKHRCRLRQWH